MSDFRQTSPNEVYFVTLRLSGWVDLFTRKVYKDIVVANLTYCQRNQNLEIFSYVIMSNHIHIICRRIDADLKELLGRFKSYVSKELLKEIENNIQESRADWLLNQFEAFAKGKKQYHKYHLWDQKNYPVLIYSPEIFEQKRNYIHQNPVKAGIVTKPESYLYSSACIESPLVCDKF